MVVVGGREGMLGPPYSFITAVQMFSEGTHTLIGTLHRTLIHVNAGVSNRATIHGHWFLDATQRARGDGEGKGGRRKGQR